MAMEPQHVSEPKTHRYPAPGGGPVRVGCRAFAFLILCSICTFAGAQSGNPSAAGLKKLSLEELMDIEITSVSRTEESLGGAAAAMFWGDGGTASTRP
jgi:hypothetical protein